MYNWPEFHLEPPMGETLAYCDECGGDIYEGDDVYKIDYDTIHAECLEDYFEEFKDVMEKRG